MEVSKKKEGEMEKAFPAKLHTLKQELRNTMPEIHIYVIEFKTKNMSCAHVLIKSKPQTKMRIIDNR